MKELTLKEDLKKDGYSQEEKYFYEINEKLKRAFKQKQVKCGDDQNVSETSSSSKEKKTAINGRG